MNASGGVQLVLKVARFIGLSPSGIITGVYVHGVIGSASTRCLSGVAFTETSQEADCRFARIMPTVSLASLTANVPTLLLALRVCSRPLLVTGAALALNIWAVSNPAASSSPRSRR